MPFPPDGLELGLGLLSIGRVWGVNRSEPPGEAEALSLLEKALDLGIRVFDTAPAYATSEDRFGRFLRGLDPFRREALVVMTKAGEHWDVESGTSVIDHSRDALRRSIDRSLELLGRVDVLQIHKATRDVVRDPAVIAAVEHARACGIATFGASVADVETGFAALAPGSTRRCSSRSTGPTRPWRRCSLPCATRTRHPSSTGRSPWAASWPLPSRAATR